MSSELGRSLIIALLGLLCALAVFEGIVAIRRRYRGEPVFSKAAGLALIEQLGSLLFFVPILLVGVLKLDSYLELLLVCGLGLAAAFVSMPIHAWTRRKRQELHAESGRANPIAVEAPGPVPAPAGVPNVGREIAIAFGLVGCLIAFVFVGLTVGKWLGGIAGAFAGFLLVPAAAVLLLHFGRFPGAVSRSETMIVAAPAERIWAVARLHETTSSYRPIIARISQVSHSPVRYRTDYRDIRTMPCATCGYPHDPERIAYSTETELLEVVENRRERSRTLPPATGDIAVRNLHRFELQTLELEPIGEMTRVTITSTADHPRLWCAIMMYVGRVPRDLLEALAAHMEGRPDRSTYGTVRIVLANAGTSARFCTGH